LSSSSSSSSSSSDETSVLWRRLDTPGHDACRLVRDGAGWRLQGAAVFADAGRPAWLAYEVVCDSRWRTVQAHVHGYVGDRSIDVEIAAAAGVWQLNGAVADAVAGCVDVDLGFTPATNLLSIRRLALAPGAAADVRAAWFDVSTRGLQPLDQRYERRGETSYWYQAPAFGYAAELEVLPSGFVRRYPKLWDAAFVSPAG
jgi:hypothetical protein